MFEETRNLSITRDPLVKGGAFVIEGTGLSVLDVIHFLFKEEAKELGILDEIIQVVWNWLYEIAPEYMEDCLTREKRTVQFRMRCLKALTQIVRQLELKKKKQELQRLLLLLMQEQKLKDEEDKIKRWYEFFWALAKKQEMQELLDQEEENRRLRIRMKELVKEELERLSEELRIINKNIEVDKVLLCKSRPAFKPC